jgi:hypothetical protein
MAFEVDVEVVEPVGDVPLLDPTEELQVFDPMKLFQSKNQPGKVGRPPDKRAAAAEWITTYLAEAGGPVKSTLIQEDAKQAGMSQKTLRRAADDMEVVKDPPGGGRNCTWDLPDDVKELMGIEVAKPAPLPTNEETPSEETPVTDDDFDAGLAELLGGGDDAD